MTHIWISIILLATNCLQLLGSDRFLDMKAISWPSPPSKSHAVTAESKSLHLEFSKDSEQLCIWWIPDNSPGDYLKMPAKCAVFDLQAKRISKDEGMQGESSETYANLFPAIAWRHQFADFVADSLNSKITLWGFTKDNLHGLRFLKPKSTAFASGTVELWRLGNSRERLWTVSIEERIAKTGIADFFITENTNYVLLAFYGNHGYILSFKDGNVIRAFTYEDEKAKREVETADKAFYASQLAFDPGTRLLACGDANSTRLRVIMMNETNKLIFRANDEHNPNKPYGGMWRVANLCFEGNGQFLVVGYRFDGRLTTKHFNPIEIYDTRSWKIVWSASAPGLSSTCLPRLSPNGRTLALIQNNILEIGPFVWN